MTQLKQLINIIFQIILIYFHLIKQRLT